MAKERKTQRRRLDDERRKGVRKEIFSWVRMIIIAVAAALILTNFVIINARVPSGSMEDTIMTGDRLIGFRLAYINKDPERGDIILFRYPVDEETIFIKRIIGLPGETIEIRDGEIYIDGSEEPLEEDYLKEEWVWENDGYTFEVPEGCYFVMGDNRNNSSDGRFWAQIALEEGVVSTQEEAEQYSFVSIDQIVGKAVFTYYSSFRMLN